MYSMSMFQLPFTLSENAKNTAVKEKKPTAIKMKTISIKPTPFICG